MPEFTTAGRTLGGLLIDRAEFRPRLADARWFVYAAGWVDPMDVNVATISIRYELDNKTQIVLGSVTASGAGFVKKAMGPFDMFATAGVPAGETIVALRLHAIKDLGVDGQIEAWTLYVRFLPALL